MPLPDDEFAGKKLILISSDPTPSLSDIFEIPLSANEQQIEGVKNLYTLEIQSEVILPQLFLNHLEGAAKFYLNLYGAFEKIAQTVRLEKSKKSILEIIAGWKDLSQKFLDFLRDESLNSFILVTIAEGLGVRLTDRLLKEFKEYGLTLGYLIVNHLINEADCLFHHRRKSMQDQYLQKLRETCSPNLKLVELPLLAEEVKGIKRIQEIAHLVFTS